jgi:transcriptional regulator with XRE-family HTH domain
VQYGAGSLLHSTLNHDKKSEGTAEITMATKVPHPVDKHVGSRVRMRRLMLGMSQEKLGDKLGLTFQQVQKYEKGTNRISASRLLEMSRILQVPVPFFFDGAPQMADRVGKGAEALSPAYVSDFLANADGLKLVRAFTQISDAKLRRSLVASSRKSSARATAKRWCA